MGGKQLITWIVGLTIAGPAFATAESQAPRNWRPVEFHLAESQVAPGLIRASVVGQQSEVFLHPRAELDDRDLDSVKAERGKYGEPLVRVHLTKTGVKKMRGLCKKYQRRSLAIVMNGKVISVPRISGPQVSGVLTITGDMSEEEAARLTQSLEVR